ncbi:hypothetical protein QRD89_05895 [Halobacillus sp. ACCC02827]|uniref:hypothetical protein n=1 Tax=Bacillaceae TaxID=186817 RepID=UPI0002A4E5F3|nr:MULTISPECIES: hypothetical protein [Bacillaceae]ELK45180.1 hypothetical protein D479_15662 [Halobacillus sp. BAB-2008]QHT46066.1 hypothetical protein M662_06025 [Bacillus sp. SB49]WJE16878.1 hypothetical protein QRD89_05895 [Halobacillus sp. ACCC02827]
MGYILPVHFYQYQDYQERVVEAHRTSYGIEKVFQADLASKLRHGDHPEVEKQKYEPLSTLYTSGRFHASEQPSPKKVENVFSEMTGKGRRFSEEV